VQVVQFLGERMVRDLGGIDRLGGAQAAQDQPVAA
jgi:hypothetical protein